MKEECPTQVYEIVIDILDAYFSKSDVEALIEYANALLEENKF